MSVSKRTRFEVLRRDGHTCRYCRSNENQLTIDHVIPVSLGGSDKPDNLVACCKDCNAGKSSSHPDADTVANVADDAIRWARAMKMAAENAAMRRAEAAGYVAAVNDCWTYYGIGQGEDRREIPRPETWEASVRQWRELGLSITDVCDSIDIAAGRCMDHKVKTSEMWRYTCGICWNKLNELQEEAKAIIDSEAA